MLWTPVLTREIVNHYFNTTVAWNHSYCIELWC